MSMTPQGYMFAGGITFSAHEEPDGTLFQAQVLMRATDPLAELGLMLGGPEPEVTFWRQTPGAAAARFGVETEVARRVVGVDGRRR